MPNPNINVERFALKKNSVTEAHWPRLPRPPKSIMSFPGMEQWWKDVQLTEERQQEMLYRLSLTKQD